jgi:hypothetical protein
MHVPRDLKIHRPSGFYFLFAALCAAVLITELAEAAPDADLWERWREHNPRATPSIDHGEWGRLVKTYVSKSPDGVNRVDYAGVTAADRMTLKDYIAKLEAIPISNTIAVSSSPTGLISTMPSRSKSCSPITRSRVFRISTSRRVCSPTAPGIGS